jgi:hypothetical protein
MMKFAPLFAEKLMPEYLNLQILHTGLGGSVS